MKMTRGSVHKRTWLYEGKKRTAYQYVFTAEVDGVPRRYRGQAPTRAEALEAMEEKQRELRNPPEPAQPAVPVMTLSQAFTRYFEAKARKRTLADDRGHGARLMAFFGKETPLSEITASRIAEYKSQRLAMTSRQTGGALATATVNRPLALLRHLLRLAHEEWGVLDAVPRIRLEKEPQGRLRWLTHEEAARLLDACRKSRNAGLVDLVEFALFTGVRQGEALGLTWDRVDRSRGVIRLEVTKSGQRREVPLSANADAVLARRWSAGAEGYVFGSRNWNTFRTAWELAVKAAKLDDFRFHDLRHTFASWLVQRGRPLPEVKDLLGHRTMTMTLRYAHLAPEHLRAAVAVLDNVLAGSATTAGTATREPQEIRS